MEQAMCLADIFIRTAVLDGGPAASKEELVGQLLALLAATGHVPRAVVPAILAAVLRREQLGSTGIGKGLAIPHARHPSVTRPLGILAACRTPVDFGSLDGEP